MPMTKSSTRFMTRPSESWIAAEERLQERLKLAMGKKAVVSSAKSLDRPSPKRALTEKKKDSSPDQKPDLTHVRYPSRAFQHTLDQQKQDVPTLRQVPKQYGNDSMVQVPKATIEIFEDQIALLKKAIAKQKEKFKDQTKKLSKSVKKITDQRKNLLREAEYLREVRNKQKEDYLCHTHCDYFRNHHDKRPSLEENRGQMFYPPQNTYPNAPYYPYYFPGLPLAQTVEDFKKQQNLLFLQSQFPIAKQLQLQNQGLYLPSANLIQEHIEMSPKANQKIAPQVFQHIPQHIIQQISQQKNPNQTSQRVANETPKKHAIESEPSDPESIRIYSNRASNTRQNEDVMERHPNMKRDYFENQLTPITKIRDNKYEIIRNKSPFKQAQQWKTNIEVNRNQDMKEFESFSPLKRKNAQTKADKERLVITGTGGAKEEFFEISSARTIQAQTNGTSEAVKSPVKQSSKQHKNQKYSNQKRDSPKISRRNAPEPFPQKSRKQLVVNVNDQSPRKKKQVAKQQQSSSSQYQNSQSSSYFTDSRQAEFQSRLKSEQDLKIESQKSHKAPRNSTVQKGQEMNSVSGASKTSQQFFSSSSYTDSQSSQTYSEASVSEGFSSKKTDSRPPDTSKNSNSKQTKNVGVSGAYKQSPKTDSKGSYKGSMTSNSYTKLRASDSYPESQSEQGKYSRESESEYDTNSRGSNTLTGSKASNQQSNSEYNSESGTGSYSRATGSQSRATSSYSRATGSQSRAAGSQSRAAGSQSRATGSQSRATGSQSRATGSYSRATGSQSRATGSQSRATGSQSRATGSYSRATGSQSRATGSQSRATGSYSRATGSQSRATGSYSRATGSQSRATGSQSRATGSYEESSREAMASRASSSAQNSSYLTESESKQSDSGTQLRRSSSREKFPKRSRSKSKGKKIVPYKMPSKEQIPPQARLPPRPVIKIMGRDNMQMSKLAKGKTNQLQKSSSPQQLQNQLQKDKSKTQKEPQEIKRDFSKKKTNQQYVSIKDLNRPDNRPNTDEESVFTLNPQSSGIASPKEIVTPTKIKVFRRIVTEEPSFK